LAEVAGGKAPHINGAAHLSFATRVPVH
jgi:hypothetical protein